MKRSLVKSLLFLLLVAPITAQAQTSDNSIASNDLLIAGSSLQLDTVTATTNIDVPVQIQTRYANRVNDQAPVVEGVSAVGELTGPGITTPLTLTTRPGY